MTEPVFRPPHTEVVQVAGDAVTTVVLPGDGVAVPIRILCDNVGIVDVDFQVRQLREHPVYAAGIRMVNVNMGGRIRSVAALVHTYIPGWLATISPHLVNDATRDKLIQYQREIVDILARVYLGVGVTATPESRDPAVQVLQQQHTALLLELRTLRDALRTAQEQSVQQTQQMSDIAAIVTELQDVIPVLPAEAAYIQAAIKRLVQRASTRTRGQARATDDAYQLLFGQFKTHFQIPRYDALPRQRYGDALRWLDAKAQELVPDDPDALPPRQERLL